MSRHVTITADDPFGLKGKNPRRVAPAVRRNITMQKVRVWGACILGIVCIDCARAPAGRSEGDALGVGSRTLWDAILLLCGLL